MFWLSKSDRIPRYSVVKGAMDIAMDKANGYWHFEVLHPIHTDVFSELFLTSRPLRCNNVLRTHVSTHCGQCAQLIFATVGDTYFYDNSCQKMRLSAIAEAEERKNCF